ncbi:hypothetical protein SMIR_41140 (plasmid) [Streptomyces mirabilis]|uniref:hypothetical protein n=1 Tax=Streptomyces mirabilis TaxID=68239 RepID=UPI001BAEF5FF|nr:hypothetical protein [Streptomyces mirabilis]QUW85483.1 hypothetical protein SMIR_41140 [Streptomyces mirabilis]
MNDTGSATKTTPGTQVTVTETEYALKLSRAAFTPGTYAFTADNAGKVAHALEVEGPGVSEAQTNRARAATRGWAWISA